MSKVHYKYDNGKMLHYRRKLVQEFPKSKNTALVIFLKYEFKMFSMINNTRKIEIVCTSVEKYLIRSDLLGKHAFRNGLLKDKDPQIVNIHGKKTNVNVSMVQ